MDFIRGSEIIEFEIEKYDHEFTRKSIKYANIFYWINQ